MIDFLEGTEANFVRQSISDDDDTEESPLDSQAERYQDLLRIMRLYRVQSQEVPLSLLEQLDLLDRLCEGDEDLLADLLATLKIEPLDAYRVVEDHLMERLRGPKQ